MGTACINQCSRGCIKCSSTNSSICLTCAPGTSLKTDGTCVRCLGSCSGSVVEAVIQKILVFV